MGLLTELVSGIKGWIVMWLTDWAVVLVAAVVFAGTFLTGRTVFSATASLGIGVVCALLGAHVVGTRLRDRLIEQQ